MLYILNIHSFSQLPQGSPRRRPPILSDLSEDPVSAPDRKPLACPQTLGLGKPP